MKRTQADFYGTVVTNCTLKSVIACSRVAAAAINVIASACFAKNCMDSSNHDGRSNIIGRLHWRHTRFRAVRESTLATEEAWWPYVLRHLLSRNVSIRTKLVVRYRG